MTERRILLINHDVSIGEVLFVCLKHLAGWEVISTNMSQANLDTLLSEHPDAILLDAILVDALPPKIHGLGFIQDMFIKQLKKNRITRSVPILLISDQATWLTREELQTMGIEGAIPKPFDPVTLPDQITRILCWK